MIELSDLQKDALIEICNVGMSKAAKQLSTLLGSRIDISIPQISLTNTVNMENMMSYKQGQVLAYVYQKLQGYVDGRALLIFNREQTRMLTKFVVSDAPKMTEKEIRACEQEAMVEIGNIIITSAISAICNMLSESVDLSVSSYGESALNQLLDEQVKNVAALSKELIVVATRLETVGENISGSLVLVLTEPSILRLLKSVDNLFGF